LRAENILFIQASQQDYTEIGKRDNCEEPNAQLWAQDFLGLNSSVNTEQSRLVYVCQWWKKRGLSNNAVLVPHRADPCQKFSKIQKLGVFLSHLEDTVSVV
jgi:hypothetical protein